MDSLDCSWPRSKAENYRRRSASVLEVKEQAFARLQEELQKAQSVREVFNLVQVLMHVQSV